MKRNTWLFLLVWFLCLPLKAEEGTEKNKPTQLSATAHRLALEEISDTVVDKVITIVGNWGDYIHGKSYQQEALVTHKNWQYTIYYNANRKLSVARRPLPSGAWQTITFSDYTFHGDDNHNVPVLGICAADGTIHLSFDHHNNPLRYRVSSKDAANRPQDVVWEASLFGPVVDSLMPGKRIPSMTYPCFVMAPDQTLYFFYREGNPHNGRTCMSKYDPSSGGWSESWQITDSAGSYSFESKTSTSRNAYQNHTCIDDKGRIHLSWVWREGGGLKDSQHDLCYMRSDDAGKTFRNYLGEMVTDGKVRAGINSPDIKVWPISPRRGLKNQQAMAIDSKGRPHIVMWYLADDVPDIKVASKDHTKSKYHYFWLDEKDKWHKQELPFPLSRDEWAARPHLAFGKNDELFLIYNRDNKIAIAAATPAGAYADWGLIKERAGNFTGEAKVDVVRLRQDNILSVYMHENPSKPHEGTPLHVIDFKIKAGK